VTRELPAYAQPLFVRLLPALDATGTFKVRKIDLVADGYDPGRIRGAMFFQVRVPRDPARHDVERNLALMAPFGGAAGVPALHVPVDPAAAERARPLLPPGDGPLVVMAPGSVWPTKRWAAEGFAALARALVGEGARVLLVGGPDDVAVADRVVALADGGVTSLAGRTDLATSVALIDRAAVLVANDSAPMHVGCARGVGAGLVEGQVAVG